MIIQEEKIVDDKLKQKRNQNIKIYKKYKTIAWDLLFY